MERARTARLLLFMSAASLLWLCAAVFYPAIQPGFGPVTAEFPGITYPSSTYPFLLKKAPPAKFVLRQYLQLARFYPTIYEFYPQDFLWSLTVNGHPVNAPGLPLSSASLEGRSIDLAPFLHPGLNEIELNMQVKSGEATLRLAVSPWDKYSLLFLVIIAGATACTAAFLCTCFRVGFFNLEFLTLLAGIFLRYFYVLGTPYFVRSFDYWGHADYLDYIIQHARLPPPGANWEAFQPPLYYMLVGGVTRLLLALGLPEAQRYLLWQGLSLLLSIGLLLIGWFIAHLLYRNNARLRCYLLAVLAVAPPLVFNAARVSNDTLLSLLAFLWLALLLSHWRQPAKTTWAGLSVVIGLALLTKANALAFVLISAICLFLDPHLTLRSRLTRLATLLVLIAAIAGGYYLPRALHATAVNTYLVGNLTNLNYHGRIDDVFRKSLIFNPFKIIRYPFVEIWGPRNDHFPEVFFKTMLLGEWIKGPFYKFLARYMMLVALLLIPPFAVGLYQALRKQMGYDVPLFVTLVGVLLAQWLFLQWAPYLSTQDFRYSSILLVPYLAFFVQGVAFYPPRWRPFLTFLLQLALLNSAIYLLSLEF